ncbi:MAG: dihydrodipicolinate synthase family protein [Caldilineaceae bacterium]|nr:dihydrodipicolinate synthase family protein [Caldilineaceae bacterium]
MKAKERLRGIFAPTLTPVHSDLTPDVGRWIDHSRRLLAGGCHGLCPFGTTSEANSFGVDERIDMLDQLVEAGIPPHVLMPGTGCCALTDTVRLTAHSVRLGCAGVLMLPPFYYKGVSDDGLFRSYSEVIERVGDHRLRIYLYHIPPISQVGISLRLIDRLVAAYPATVVGIKDSSGDWNNLQALLEEFPGFGTFTGNEKFLLKTLQGGGAGTINAVANVMPEPQRTLYEQWQLPEALAMQQEIDRLRTAMQGFPTIAALKQIIAVTRNDPSWLNLRPPLTMLTPAEVDELLNKAAALPYLQLPAMA